MAKTNWTSIDTVQPTDMNQIGSEINQLRTDVDDFEIPIGSTAQKGILQLSNQITSQSQTLAATAKAVDDARASAISASLPRTGGSLTGPLKISSWGTLSAGSGGYFLCGQNCYLDAAGTTFRYQNTHSTMGARGFVFRLGFENAWYFDTGIVATVQDQQFTPVLKQVITAADLNKKTWGAL